MQGMCSSLIGIVAHHELRVLTRGAAARAVVILVIVLSTVALIAGIARARADADDRAVLEAWTQQQRAALQAEATAEQRVAMAARPSVARTAAGADADDRAVLEALTQKQRAAQQAEAAAEQRMAMAARPSVARTAAGADAASDAATSVLSGPAVDAAAGTATETADGAPVWGPRSAELIANERGTYAVAPPAPLAALTLGESDRHPSHYRVTARLREAHLTASHVEHPLALVTGHLDLTFIVIFFLPLAIIALGYDLTAEERRTGTLRMVLARPVTLRAVVFGKLLARSLAVLALVSVIAIFTLAVFASASASAFVSASASASVSASGGMMTQMLFRLAWWNAITIAYAAFWLALTVYVDARGRSAPANALILATMWLIVTVLLPAAIALTAGVAHPAPSGVQLATAIRAATHAAAVETGRELGAFLEDHPSSGVGRAGMQQYAALQNTRETMVARRLQPTLTAFATRREHRRAFAARLQYLSPAMLAQAALSDIAGTNERRRQAFETQAVAFQQTWKNFFAPRLASAHALDPADYARMPSFTFEEEPLRAIAGRIAAPFVVLTIAATVLLGIALRRYETHQP